MRRHTLLLGETSSCPPPNSPTHCKLGSWDRWSNASSSFSRGMRWKAGVSICDITFRKTPFHLRHSLFTLAFWLRLAKKRLRKADMHMMIISNSHFDKCGKNANVNSGREWGSAEASDHDRRLGCGLRFLGVLIMRSARVS